MTFVLEYPSVARERIDGHSGDSGQLVTMNWRGKPLATCRVIVELIGATTTGKCLRVHADSTRPYYPGVKGADAEIADVPLTAPDWHG